MAKRKIKIDDIIKKLSKRELQVLLFIIKYPECTARKISYLLEIHYTKVYNYINSLEKMDLIYIKKGRQNKYISEVILGEF